MFSAGSRAVRTLAVPANSYDDRRLTGSRRLDRPPVPNRPSPDGGTADESIHDRLEATDRPTRGRLAKHQTAEPAKLEDVSEATRREARRHVREIRAETSSVACCVGLDAAIPYRPSNSRDESV